MSLLNDPDYLIHSLRLNYLRHVDDPYGPRLISIDPSYDSNPYVLSSGLADVEKWPELAMPSSPTPSDDEGGFNRRFNGYSGFPGASRLKYTTTIMGPSRIGAMGIRVSGKRASVAKNSYRFSLRSEGRNVKGAAEQRQETEDAADGPSAATATSPIKAEALPSPDLTTSVNASAGDKEHVHEENEPPKAISPEFHPKFKGAAEMEARRKLRMLSRVRPSVMETKGSTRAPNLNPEFSSSESGSEGDVENVEADEDDDDFDVIAEADESLDIEGDDSDADFVETQALETMEDIHSDSDDESILSETNSVVSTSASSLMGTSLHRSNSGRVHSRLSPVRESRYSDEQVGDVLPDRPEESAPIDSGFEMVIPAPKVQKIQQADLITEIHSPTISSEASARTNNIFARRPVQSIRPMKSALSAMLAESSGSSSSNPFAELYSAIAGRSGSDSMTVNVFFPSAQKPAGRTLKLQVRKDATVEEVIGFALWTYWEEGWLPKIDEGLEGEDDPQWEIRCSAVGWIMRIAEDDGEVDEDFPPPDRTGKISKFNFDAYAVLEATPAQIQQNKILESKIQRRLSRIVVKKKKSVGLLNATTGVPALALPVDSFLGTSAGISSLASSVGMFPSSLGPSTSHGAQQFLRIRIADTADAGHVSTTIPATSGMYMAEVLELVCQKQKLSNSKDYALALDLGPTKHYIPLDRTVKSLQGKRDLILMKKSMLQSYGVEMSQGTTRTTDPNASIITPDSEVLEPSFNPLLDYTNAYKKYTVYRKVPMLGPRSARLLAIDGGYIHIIPMSNKSRYVFDSSKTASYHLKSVVACQQSRKNSSSFKLVVHSEERHKRYDFEAEDTKAAAEIAQTVRTLKQAMERLGTTKQSRRSRHVS